MTLTPNEAQFQRSRQSRVSLALYVIFPLSILILAAVTLAPIHRQSSTQLEALSTATTTPQTVVTTPIVSSQIRVDEHLAIDETLRDVSFCGSTYRAKQVLIDGIDVVRRIADFATERKLVSMYPQYKGTGEICRKLELKKQEHAVLKVIVHSSGQIEGGNTVYPLDVESIPFIVNPSMNNIAEVGGPEFPDLGNFGVFIPIGELK